MAVKKQEYFEGVGRRKTSIARVRIFNDTGSKTAHIIVNKKDFKTYFPTKEMQNVAENPFKTSKTKNMSVSVKVVGGGIHSQAEAVRHGISVALTKMNPELRKILKPEGFLKRDPRMKERRKFGLKKARKAPQWSKR
jgi:small subunit ribosomal protein S9